MSDHRNQGKTKELFQTEGNQRNMTTAHNVWLWTGSFCCNKKKMLLGLLKFEWGLRIQCSNASMLTPDFDG